MTELERLAAACQGEVIVAFNPHRTNYESIDDYLKLHEECHPCSAPLCSDAVRAEIVRLGRIVDLQFYPDTPVGFHRVVHYDLGEAVREAFDILDGGE